ncbi:hypothetical protein FB567DRAFT_159033 [Paraphoma chrysanthemicola]|uniref:2EXR domain-containing protein n=1 Tax=Paraphoma chrysanthemicola TaxID=798071 RepID=A0A8K0W303_9PLEO|nr:hypothetical protein FB567DRAFT_159033 [Paraphoma chrysanthemicola]
MSIARLPKELRLHIWSLAYFAEPPRLVALRTKPHNQDHDEQTFCPRYSPSPAPVVVNVCHEARTEASYQARKAGHIVCLQHGPSHRSTLENLQSIEDFYFRFETDILYLPLEGAHVQHFDDSPEVGLLHHFGIADCDASRLRNIAIGKVIWSGYYDGSFSNTIRMFPKISRLIMMVPDEVMERDPSKPVFVRAARRLVTLYKFDMRHGSGDPNDIMSLDVEFARLVAGALAIVPKETWAGWSDLGCEWVSADGPAQFNESMSWN